MLPPEHGECEVVVGGRAEHFERGALGEALRDGEAQIGAGQPEADSRAVFLRVCRRSSPEQAQAEERKQEIFQVENREMRALADR